MVADAGGLPPGLLAAIDSAVEHAGGEKADARGLGEVWGRAERDTASRADGIRAAVAVRGCSCADGGHAGAGGRCERCVGRLEEGAQ
jgi:hypothetical protein